MEAIRGVNSDYSIQKLLEKELVIIRGRNENLPGKPLVYSTSKAFMDYFGINDTNDLPKIKEVLAEQMIEATVVNSALNAHEDDAYRQGMVEDTPKQQIELFDENRGQLNPSLDINETVPKDGSAEGAIALNETEVTGDISVNDSSAADEENDIANNDEAPVAESFGDDDASNDNGEEVDPENNQQA